MPSSPFGLTEIWRIFKVFNKPKVDKAKETRDALKDTSSPKGKGKSKEPSSQNTTTQASTVLDGPDESSKDGDIKSSILQAMADMADIHERVKK